MLCTNCHHDGRTTPATWRGRRIAVCDEHKAYHERLHALTPLYRVGRPEARQLLNFQPL